MRRGRLAVAICGLLFAPCATQAGAMRPFTAQSVAQIAEARGDQPYILVFWSLSCAPCVKELPKWAARQQRYPRVPVLLVDLDPPEEQAAAAKALRRRGVRGLELWGLAEAVPERVYWAVDPKWHGETPYARFFDAKRGARGVVGVADEAELRRWYGAAISGR